MNPATTTVAGRPGEQVEEGSPAAADGANHPPPTALPQLLGQLALPLWGLTALPLADETGLLAALDEPGLPALEGLLERLEGAHGRFLDIGVGVAALVTGLCRRYPELTGVGIDPLDAALLQARGNVADAGLSSRIELRKGRIEDLTEQ